MSATGLHLGLDEATYHADRESLSVSGAKTLLRCPALFKWQQDHPVHKDVFDIGSATHALVLGVGDPIEVIDAQNWMTKAAKEARDAARAEGKTPLLTADYERVQAMADALSSHSLAMRLLSQGEPEVSAYAPDEETGVMRRARFDWLGPSVVTDYKSCADASPQGFANACARYDYAMQARWYLDIARDLGRDVDAFAFIAQEKEPPYLIEVYELDAEALEVGARKNREALERFRDCTASGLWPGYTGREFTTLSLPRWAVA